jgi:hypothetical protein
MGRRFKTGWVAYEVIRSGELVPCCDVITICLNDKETFEFVLHALFAKDAVYKGVFESRNEARQWVDDWKSKEEKDARRVSEM